MTLTKAFSRTFKRIAKAERGSTAVIFALSLMPILVAAGAAMDFVSFYNQRNQLQAALDAGALAGATAKGATNAQRVTIATDTFKANLSADSLSNVSLTVSYVPNAKTVAGTAHVEIPSLFMQLASMNKLEMDTHTEVMIPSDKKAEIAFVLDYSGSMTEVAGSQIKYIAMRDAVTKLVNSLTAANPSKLKFGLVPFSDQVFTDLPKSTVYGQTGPGMWTGCTLDNPAPYNLTDTVPTAGNGSKWNQPTPAWLWTSGCGGYASRQLKVRPLSNDFAGLKAQIAAMTPYANTHIALGVQFGYQLLSPNGVYNSGGAIADYSDTNTIKYLVLLTDGTQTEAAFGPGGVRSITQGENNLVALCDNAKASGIQILTMAVGVSDAATSARLQGCASDPTNNFFVVNTADDMAAAFDTITGQIAQQAYLSK
ncbi:MAG: VWA domain-containing protein [Alphaproteobacteria bacterium]|nr:VWA domain-containing protein [Alphaproteobacteria bacterium]